MALVLQPARLKCQAHEQEFEDARFERDPEIIARLLVGGSEAIEKITDRMVDKVRTFPPFRTIRAVRAQGRRERGGIGAHMAPCDAVRHRRWSRRSKLSSIRTQHVLMP